MSPRRYGRAQFPNHPCGLGSLEALECLCFRGSVANIQVLLQTLVDGWGLCSMARASNLHFLRLPAPDFYLLGGWLVFLLVMGVCVVCAWTELLFFFALCTFFPPNEMTCTSPASFEEEKTTTRLHIMPPSTILKNENVHIFYHVVKMCYCTCPFTSSKIEMKFASKKEKPHGFVAWLSKIRSRSLGC